MLYRWRHEDRVEHREEQQYEAEPDEATPDDGTFHDDGADGPPQDVEDEPGADPEPEDECS
jgi:hypothetical protein